MAAGFFLGMLFIDLDNLEKSVNMGLAVSLAFVFGILGYSAFPRIIYEFADPYWRLYMICGPIGIAFIKLSMVVFKADGKILKKEVAHLNSYMKKEFGEFILIPLNDFLLQNKNIYEDVFDIALPIKDIRVSDRIDILYRLLSFAAADRIFNNEEERIIREISKSIRIGSKRFEIIKNRVLKEKGYRTESRQEQGKQSQYRNFYIMDNLIKISYNPYLVLEIDQNATNEDLKKAYRNLVKKHHPDKSMTKDELTRKQDAKKILEINEAYESIKTIRGIK